ncbi:hypothetical protein DFP72DRAFT_1109714 [Ephemerocybe angulata]|uniref:Uncharacterized protein n=1 Tax=Ephemerocybe angulata TaxID=980116 RepID=A0A8H6H7U0_9AGAR|nr:hypothetical protein DFP72DRAFT_1109714 [Tulosesus angulatus]
MSPNAEDIAHWSSVLFEGEQTLEHVVETMKKDRHAYTIKQAKTGYRGNWFLWDKETDDAVLLTHAFVVAYSTPLDTGNFVPEGCTAPEGMFDSQLRREPGPRAQINITYDYSVDTNLAEYVEFFETWVKGIPDFNKVKRERSKWMTPSYIADSSRHTVSIPIFQRKTAFNCKDGKYEVPYDVNPWIAEASFPHNQQWIPNPAIVRVLELGNDETLIDVLKSSDDPSLSSGDLVKMTFKVNFAVGPSSWTSNYMPIQIIRVGRVNRDLSTPVVHSENAESYNLPKVGDKLGTYITKGTKSKKERHKSEEWDSDAFDEETDVDQKEASSLKEPTDKGRTRQAGRKGKGKMTLDTEDEMTSDPGLQEEAPKRDRDEPGKKKRHAKAKPK